MKESQVAKKEMMQTFQTIWKHASPAARNYIEEMWTKVIKPAHVVSWKSATKAQEYEYQLELEQEVVGNHPEIPMGELILKETIIIVFSEEKIPETTHYRQIISFPDKGVCFRIGMGWLSKELPIQRIIIEEKQHNILCTVEALGQSITKSGEEALAFWEKTNWYV